MTTIDSTLNERGARYGSFEQHAIISQLLQDTLREGGDGEGWKRLAPDQRQALTTICDKMARMINGDANYRDNWHDIVGYAKLVDDRMLRDEEAAAAAVQAEAQAALAAAAAVPAKTRTTRAGK